MSVGVITIDGTKIKAERVDGSEPSHSGLAQRHPARTEETDRREGRALRRGSRHESPEPLRNPETRRQASADAKRRLAERSVRPARSRVDPEELEMDLEAAVMGRPVLRRGGWIEWLRSPWRELEAFRTRRAAPDRT